MMIRSSHPWLLAITFLAAAVFAAGQPTSDSSVSRPLPETSGAAAQRAHSDGKLDLGAPFDVEMKATVGKDGRFDPASIVFTRSDGDARMTELVKNYLATIDQSGYTRYLTDIGSSEIAVRARQDNSLFNATVTSETSGALRAIAVKTMASTMISLLRTQKDHANASEADRRDLTLLNGTTASSSGRSVIIALELPKATFREMVEKELKK